MTTGLSLKGIEKSYGGLGVLRGIDIDAPPGSYVVLLGPSGSGKTTLLNIVAGFDSANAGSVRIDGQDIGHLASARRPTATVFQDYALFPHMSVIANVEFGLRMRGVTKAQRMIDAAAALALVDLKDHGDRRIHELSGGQRQRVALARAIVVKPKVLLLDEPLGALDLSLRRQMQRELGLLQKRIGATFLHITHDQEEAMSLADLLVVMSGGRIEDSGPPARVFHHPKSLFAATFVGENNLIPARLLETTDGIARFSTALGDIVLAGGSRMLPGKMTLAIRPGRIRLAENLPGHQALGTGVVEETMFMGTYHNLRIRSTVATDLVLGVQVPSSPPPIGSKVPLASETEGFSVIEAGGLQ